jgi:hypothetical protein
MSPVLRFRYVKKKKNQENEENEERRERKRERERDYYLCCNRILHKKKKLYKSYKTYIEIYIISKKNNLRENKKYKIFYFQQR